MGIEVIDMHTYITNVCVNGIKNIDQEVQFDFYKKTLPKQFTLDNSNIKAIYGENGAGKSAIIHAIDIYKKIQFQKDYLSDSNVKQSLSSLMNKSLQRLTIAITFIVIDEVKIYAQYQHTLEIQQENDEYFIDKEIFAQLLSHKVQGSSRIELLRIERGVLIQKKLEITEDLRQNTTNLLKHHSFISLYIHQRKDHFETTYGSEIDLMCNCLIFMAVSIHVYLNESDHHNRIGDYVIKQMLGDVEETYHRPFKKRDDSNVFHIMDSNADVIGKEDKASYLENIADLARFIRIFKPELQDIEVEMKENKDTYVCEKYFKYKDYRIHVEFESTGLKKLVTLFEAFQYFVNGESVFIDELDANIHDVYFIRLLEYFTYYAKGQLCFTTHNLGPMEVLKKQKFAIDFLSCDHKVTPWKKRGNYSVVNLYREGMIENSPFNIEPFDFAGVFHKDS